MPINNQRIKEKVRFMAQEILDKIRNEKNPKVEPVVKKPPVSPVDKDDKAGKDVGYKVVVFPDNRIIIGKITDSKVLKRIKELFGHKPKKTEMLNAWTEEVSTFTEGLVQKSKTKGALSQFRRHFRFTIWYLNAKELHVLFPDGAKEDGVFKDLTKEQREKVNNEIMRFEGERKKRLSEAHKRAAEAEKAESKKDKKEKTPLKNPKVDKPKAKQTAKKDDEVPKKKRIIVKTPDILKRKKK